MPNNNQSYWEFSTFFSGYDVMIIGSGIVGLSAALHLKLQQPKLKVGILEAGFLPSGATTKNAGFACFGSVSELLDELQSSTEGEVMEVVEMRWQGLLRLKETLGIKAIDYQQLGGYEIFKPENRGYSEECIDQISYLNKLLSKITGQPDIYSVANDKIAGFGFSGVNSMIMNRCEAQIDPGKMTFALTSMVEGLGVPIFNNCELLSMEKNEHGHILKTNQTNFRAKKIIMANNAFISGFYPDLNIIPGRGQVLVTEPITNLKINGTFHYDRGYYYFRNINNRILLGGGRNIDFKAEETKEPGVTEYVQSALENLLYQIIIPDQAAKIEYRWSGVMAFGDSLKPLIKQLEPHVFCAVRCNGMGIAVGSLSGELVAQLVLRDL